MILFCRPASSLSSKQTGSGLPAAAARFRRGYESSVSLFLGEVVLFVRENGHIQAFLSALRKTSRSAKGIPDSLFRLKTEIPTGRHPASMTQLVSPASSFSSWLNSTQILLMILPAGARWVRRTKPYPDLIAVCLNVHQHHHWLPVARQMFAGCRLARNGGGVGFARQRRGKTETSSHANCRTKFATVTPCPFSCRGYRRFSKLIYRGRRSATGPYQAAPSGIKLQIDFSRTIGILREIDRCRRHS